MEADERQSGGESSRDLLAPNTSWGPSILLLTDEWLSGKVPGLDMERPGRPRGFPSGIPGKTGFQALPSRAR